MKRKEFIKKSAFVGIATFATPLLLHSESNNMKVSKILNIKPLGFPWETRDPFLFCVHHRDEYPKGNDKMGVGKNALKGRNIGNDFVIKDGWRMYHGKSIPGFPHHPHRGFETITINKEGVIDHCDSLGGQGRFEKGDVQWMTAGSGIQHSEMFPLVHNDKPNPLEIFQIWLNLPKKDKLVNPHYKMLWNDTIPLIIQKDDNGKVTEFNLIAGNLGNAKAPNPTPNSWATNLENGVKILTIKMDANAKWTLKKSLKEVNKTLYFYKGRSISIDNKTINVNYLLELNPNEDIEIINNKEDAFLLLLEGKPINEPVVKYGPFVMNTQEEIEAAFRDYNQTKFGGWPWKDTEITHGKKEKFERHSS